MKKLNVLLIVSMLAAALLAANPPGKLVRLDVLNNSGDTIYMRLIGRNTGAFYYLTIPAGEDKSFTVLVDSYRRTTWACGGIVSGGSLNMTGNVRLNFVPCGTFPVRRVGWDYNDDGDTDDAFDLDADGDIDLAEGEGLAPNFGEPTQEKVVYFLGYQNWAWIKLGGMTTNLAGYWNSFAYWLRIKFTYAIYQRVRSPRGMFMRYRY